MQSLAVSSGGVSITGASTVGGQFTATGAVSVQAVTVRASSVDAPRETQLPTQSGHDVSAQSWWSPFNAATERLS